MAYCTGCGIQIADTARFCAACGTANATLADHAASAGGVPSSSQQGSVKPPPPAAAYPGRPSLSPPSSTESSGGARWILPIVIVISVAAIAALLWSQRDGARPIAGEKSVAASKESRAASTDTAGEVSEARHTATAPTIPDRSVDVADHAADELTSGTGSVIATSAAALDSAFLADPEGAAERYAVPIEVSGTIATMVTPGPTPALSLEGRSRFNYMVVNFPRGYRERLATLAKGDRITVRCGSVQALGGTTILSDCTL